MSDAETIRNWMILTGPLGAEWSGRARYAAAMHFYQSGDMSADVLEIYRICARIDGENPLETLARYGIGDDWIKKVGDRGQDVIAPPSARTP